MSLRIATYLIPFWLANFANTVPWNGSMKHTRKTYGLVRPFSFVTRGFVDDGEIIGTWF